ncbi:MAG: hypothetical protein ACLTDR_02320 [Adlercreutzia equolifaciens]
MFHGSTHTSTSRQVYPTTRRARGSHGDAGQRRRHPHRPSLTEAAIILGREWQGADVDEPTVREMILELREGAGAKTY